MSGVVRVGGTCFSTIRVPKHRLPTLADYPNLKYTEQVFAESMRLYPPAWAMGRMAIKETALGEYDIPKRRAPLLQPIHPLPHPRVLP